MGDWRNRWCQEVGQVTAGRNTTLMSNIRLKLSHFSFENVIFRISISFEIYTFDISYLFCVVELCHLELYRLL